MTSKLSELILQLRWFWGHAKGCRLQAGLNVLTGLMQVGADFAFIYVSKMIIDTAVGVGETHSLWLLTALLLGIAAMQILLRLAHQWIAALLGIKAQNRLQERIFRRVLESVWQGRERRHTGDVINRLEKDVRVIIEMAAEKLPLLVVVLCRLVGAFGFLCILDARLAVIVVCVLPVFIGLSRVYFQRMRTLTREVRQTESRVQSVMQEMIQRQLVVKTLQQVPGAVCRLVGIHDWLRGQVLTQTRFRTFSLAVISVGFTGVYLLSFLWGAYQLHEHIITYGTMIAFMQLVAQIQLPFRDLTHFIPAFINMFTSIERLMEMDSLPAEDESGETFRRGDAAPLGIRFKDVAYRYTDRQRWVLKDLTVDFRPGTLNIIVGQTGSGKTTMMRMMLALLHPSEGSVEMYSADASLPVSVATRSEILYVPQGNTLLSGTIRENLLFAKEDSTDEEMRAALEFSKAEYVYSLSNGIDTKCGEQGLGLSEGQAQRIAIARSLLHGGRILLLDEVTSALDMDTTHQLLSNLVSLKEQGKTIIFVTHRRDLLRYADNVLHL